MWIEALSTAHIEQENDLEIFDLLPLERVKTEDYLKTGDTLFAITEKTFIVLDGCVAPATYHCAFKQMVLLALKSSTVNSLPNL
ncbi:hypothetical protein TNCV_1268411 [Trichonephila clavipes]|nr:hypothetical protein TNCV_1268411 [Trichonephila clavipes]